MEDKLKLLAYYLEKKPVPGLQVEGRRVLRRGQMLTPWEIDDILRPMFEAERDEYVKKHYLASLKLDIENVEFAKNPYGKL